MNFADVKKVTIPQGTVKKITSGGVVIWQAPPAYKNWVKYSTEANSTAIYNGGLGYKDGYRVRSGGAEAAQTWTTCTGYIPYKKGDKLYIYPPFTGVNAANCVNFFDSSYTNLGQINDNGMGYGFCNNTFDPVVVNGVSVLDISAVTVSGVNNIAFVRITHMINDGKNSTAQSSPIKSGSEIIITKNEVLTL